MVALHHARHSALLILLLLGCLLPACIAPAPPVAMQPIQPPPVSQEVLVGPVWQWVEAGIGKLAFQWPIPEPERYTVSFAADGSVSVKADCNQVSGTYVVQDGRLRIVLGPSTMAFCGEQSLGQQFTALLSEVVEGSMVDEQLLLNLADDSWYLRLQPGSEASSNEASITPQDIQLDTQGLPTSWQANTVAASPYDDSQAPGPTGLPEHIQINFGVTDAAGKQPGDPVLYIIPVDAYRELWAQAGNDTVARTIDEIFKLTVALPSPPPTMGLPALPVEEIGGVNDLAVQIDRAASTDLSATKNGYRFVGRWAQSPNPVVNGNLRYVYQGFTNDGRYLVSFFYPVTTAALPNSAADVPAEEIAQMESDPTTYMQSQAGALNELPTSEWMPDLTTLDALVASLQITGIPPNGLQGNIWRPLATTSAPGSAETPVADAQKYSVVYYADGNLEYVADCSASLGTYTLSGGMVGNIRTTLATTDLPDCGVDSFADELVGTLMSAQNYRLLPGGTRMELIRPAGGGSLFFELVGAAASIPAPAP